MVYNIKCIGRIYIDRKNSQKNKANKKNNKKNREKYHVLSKEKII